MAETEIVSKKCGQGKLKAATCDASSAFWHIANLPLTPIDIEGAAALTALVRLLAVLSKNSSDVKMWRL